jgi:uncharacterized protein YprB with RNaseH-like and TPR domain
LISSTWQHVYGIGPQRESQLISAGFINWECALSAPEKLPLNEPFKSRLLRETEQSIKAYSEGDLKWLLKKFPTRDHHKILWEYRNDITYFDIETTGFGGPDSEISVIVALHKGQVFEFISGQNLNDFAELLLDVRLLCSFNGSSFDVPFVLNTFRIPELPCAHIDLRWVCYYAGLEGGLKSIEKQLGFNRPDSIAGIDGYLAVLLWQDYQQNHSEQSLHQLVEYCREDVLMMPAICTSLFDKTQENQVQKLSA